MSKRTQSCHLYRTLKNNDNNDITVVLVHPKKKKMPCRQGVITEKIETGINCLLIKRNEIVYTHLHSGPREKLQISNRFEILKSLNRR